MQKLTGNVYLRGFGIILGSFLMGLIVVRPSVWQNVLSFELGLAKTGMFLGVYLLMFWGMFGGKSRLTTIHRVSRWVSTILWWVSLQNFLRL